MDFFKDLYQYRELLKTNVHKDIRGRYKGSFLGILWTFLNPLLQVFVYYLVFPYLFRASLIPNFLCFLITGIIPWNLFITVVNGGTTVFKANGGIIKKVYFPREILLVSQVLSGIVNFLISCIIILIFCICTGAGISYHLILLPVLIAIEGLLSLGIIFILGSINVYVQDMENIVQFILNLLFYGTPIIYSLSMFSSAKGTILFKLVEINPLTIIINGYRDIFLNHVWPDPIPLFCVFMLAVVTCIVGYFIFKKLEKGFAEEL